MTRYRMMNVVRHDAPKDEVFRFFKTLVTNIIDDGGVICRFQNMGITDTPLMMRRRGEIITHVQHFFFEFYASPKTMILRSMVEKVKERALYSPMPKQKETHLDYDIFTQYGDKLMKNDTTKDMIIKVKDEHYYEVDEVSSDGDDEEESKLSDENI